MRQTVLWNKKEGRRQGEYPCPSSLRHQPSLHTCSHPCSSRTSPSLPCLQPHNKPSGHYYLSVWTESPPWFSLLCLIVWEHLYISSLQKSGILHHAVVEPLMLQVKKTDQGTWVGTRALQLGQHAGPWRRRPVPQDNCHSGVFPMWKQEGNWYLSLLDVENWD